MRVPPREHDPTLPLLCPKCNHAEARRFVSSYTVLTVTCTKCTHTWSAELLNVPEAVRVALSLPRRPGA